MLHVKYKNPLKVPENPLKIPYKKSLLFPKSMVYYI